MRDETTIKFTKPTTWIVFLSIIGLIFISVFPWISVDENRPVEEKLYFNFEMMKKSNNDDIVNLSERINLINVLFFLITILGVLSYLSLTFYKIHKSKLYIKMITVFIAASLLILSLLILYLQFDFITIVEEFEVISLAYAIPFIKYNYFLLVISLFILLYSISYIWRIASYHYKEYKDTKKLKDNLKMSISTNTYPETQKQNSLIEIEMDQKETDIKEKSTNKITLKDENVEDWLKDEFKNIEKPSEKEPEEQKIEIKKETETIEKSKEIKPEEIALKEEKDIDEKKQSDKKITQFYEKALNSAINKKQDEIKQRQKENQKNEETKKENIKEISSVDSSEQVKHESEKKSINVYCPNCGNVFMVEKTGFTMNTKCPRCGREINL